MPSETISNFKGFPSDGLFYSENMIAGEFGLDAYVKLRDVTIGGTPTGAFTWFTEFLGKIWACDITGELFSTESTSVLSNFDARHNPTSSSGNGLITDQKGRLLYARTQYLGMTSDGTNFNGTFKDFGENATEYRPADTYEDWVVFGNNNKLAVLNTSDDSFNASAFTLPSGFVVRAVKTNRTGVLVAANYQSRGMVFLWDVRSQRSISDWIWFDQRVQSLCKAGDGWIITTTKEQWLSNGYALVRQLPAYPDVLMQNLTYTVLPQGTMFVNGKLYTVNSGASFTTRHKPGLYILDLATSRFSLVTPDGGRKDELFMGAIFQNSNAETVVSYQTAIPTASKAATLIHDTPTQALAIVGPFGNTPNKKVATTISPEFVASVLKQNLYQNTAEVAQATVKVKIYNFRRQLWAYGVTSSTSPAADKLSVSGNSSSRNNAKIGDEVTVLSGANAGQVRHITAIADRNTADEVWTLDSALPTTTESGVLLSVQPFQLVSSKTITASNYEDLDDLVFDIKNRIKGRKFLVKFVIEGVTDLPLTLSSVTLTYDEQGINKTE